jgi:hypothetical protein
VPIALHFLRRKPRRDVVFPTLRFLAPTAARATRSQRLRRWLTLILRCLVILLFCLAFARPFLGQSRSATGRAVVVAVDNSFSMQARGRWEPLRAWALGQLEPLRGGDEAGLLLMNPTPRWLVAPTSDLARVRQELGQLAPGYEVTHYDPALRFAGEALLHTGFRDLAIAWMGDEQQAGWQGVDLAQPLPPGVRISFPPEPPPPTRHAAITAAVLEGSDDAERVRVSVTQYVPERDTRTLTITAAGQVLATQSVVLLAGHPNTFVLALAKPAAPAAVPPLRPGGFKLAFLPTPTAYGGRSAEEMKAELARHGDPGERPELALKVALDEDDLPADDAYYLTRPSAPGRAVVVGETQPASAGFDYLLQALSSASVNAVAPNNYGLLRKRYDSEWKRGMVVMVRGSAAFEPAAAEKLDKYLDAGGHAWIFVDGNPGEVAWLERNQVAVRRIPRPSEREALHLRNWNLAHPALAPLSSELDRLLAVSWYDGYAIESEDAVPLATWDDGSYALAEIDHGGRHFLLAGFMLDRRFTSWPVEPTFVGFVNSTTGWLAQLREPAGSWHVGDTVPLAGEGAWRTTDSPRGVAVLGVSGSVQPDAPGLYDREVAGRHQAYAVNVRTEESDLAPWRGPGSYLSLASSAPRTASADAGPRRVQLPREDAEAQGRVWWWLLAAALVLLLAEMGVSNRSNL